MAAPAPIDPAAYPALDKTVTLVCLGEPIADVLADLSTRYGVRLSAARAVGEQRVTLAVTDQPLRDVLKNLASVLCHDAAQATHFWTRATDADGAASFTLVRQSTADALALRESLATPRRRIGPLLTEWRDLLKKTPEERKRLKSALPPDLFDPTDWDGRLCGAIVMTLSDRQISTLARGGTVSVPSRFAADLVSRYNTDRRKDEESWHQQAVARAMKRGEELRVPTFSPPVRVGERVTLRIGGQTNGGNQQSLWFLRTLRLDGLSANIGAGFDTLASVPSPDPDPALPPETPVDLTPYLTANGVTNRQRNSLPFILLALSRAAHLTIYEEHYYKESPLGGPSGGLNRLYHWKETPTKILAAICDQYGYELERQGNTCLLRSSTWAFDRQADTSGRRAAPWRARLLRQKDTFTQDDLRSIAATFTWPQAAISLPQALDENVADPPDTDEYTVPYRYVFSGLADYEQMRVWSLLSPDECRAAQEREGGLPVAALSASTVDEVVRWAIALRRMEPDDPKTASVREAALTGRLRLVPERHPPAYRNPIPPQLDLILPPIP